MGKIKKPTRTRDGTKGEETGKRKQTRGKTEEKDGCRDTEARKNGLKKMEMRAE